MWGGGGRRREKRREEGGVDGSLQAGGGWAGEVGEWVSRGVQVWRAYSEGGSWGQGGPCYALAALHWSALLPGPDPLPTPPSHTIHPPVC